MRKALGSNPSGSSFSGKHVAVKANASRRPFVQKFVDQACEHRHSRHIEVQSRGESSPFEDERDTAAERE